MADNENFTQSLQEFLRNNTPGGYIQTKINISDNDLTERIETILSTKDYLTSGAIISWDQVQHPAFQAIAFSGKYDDLTQKLELADVARTGDYYSLKNYPTNVGNIDSSSLSTVALSGEYNDLKNLPDENHTYNFSNLAFSGHYNDLEGVPNFIKIEDLDLATVAVSGLYKDLDGVPFQTKEEAQAAVVKVYDITAAPAFADVTGSTVLTDINNLKMEKRIDDDVPSLLDFLQELIFTYYTPGDEYAPNIYHPVIIKLITKFGAFFITDIHKHVDNEKGINLFLFSLIGSEKRINNENIQKFIAAIEDDTITDDNILNDLVSTQLKLIVIFDYNNEKLYIKKV